ncbi:hypothetical protein ABID20_002305 [Rhizobium alvei]
MDGPPIMECLVQCVEDKTRLRRPACPPANDAAGEGVDHESNVYEALPGRDICEIGYGTARQPDEIEQKIAELWRRLS